MCIAHGMSVGSPASLRRPANAEPGHAGHARDAGGVGRPTSALPNSFVGTPDSHFASWSKSARGPKSRRRG
eukprot:742617-Alexandrium_andersonii.AAC.1